MIIQYYLHPLKTPTGDGSVLRSHAALLRQLLASLFKNLEKIDKLLKLNQCSTIFENPRPDE